MNNILRESEKQKGMSLVGRVILVVVAIAVVFGGTETYVIYQSSRASLIASTDKGLLSTVAEQADEIERIFLDSQNDAKGLASQDSVVSFLTASQSILTPDKNQERPVVEDMLVHDSTGGDYRSIFLLDSSGTVVVSTESSLMGKDLSAADYFEAAGGGPWADFSIGVSSTLPDYYFSEPVDDQSGHQVGVAVLELPGNVVNDTLLDKTIQMLNGTGMLIDPNGLILFANDPRRVFKTLGPVSDAEKARLSFKYQLPTSGWQSLQLTALQNEIRNYSIPIVVSFFDTVNNYGTHAALAKIGDSPFFITEEIKDSVIVASAVSEAEVLAIYAMTAALLAAIVMVFVISKFITQLKKLVNFAKTVSQGNFNEHIVMPGVFELKVVADAMNTMVATIAASNATQEATIEEKTLQLSRKVEELAHQNQSLAETKIAIFNLLDDLGMERDMMSKEKNRIEAILNAVGDAVFAVDSVYHITLMNPYAAYLSGFESENSLGKYYGDIFKFKLSDKDTSLLTNMVEEAMRSGVSSDISGRMVMLRKSGDLLPISIAITPMGDKADKVFGAVVVIRDMRKERDLEEAKNDFLSIAAHQLRTPLGSMRWSIEMLADGDVGPIPDPALKVLQQMHENNQRLIDLVNSLLDVSRIDQGRVKNNPEPADVLDVVRDVVAEIGPEAVKKNLTIQVDLKDKPLQRVMADRQLLHEILENLMSNAIKYTPSDGKVIIDGENSTGDTVILSITDNGIGITKADQAKIFSKFFRAKNAVVSETSGTGLGLFVVKSYVESWGGTVWFESEEGKGSTFYVKLPTAENGK